MADEDIFGLNLRHLKGNTTRKKSPADTVTRVAIPPEINERYMDITLSIDIMFMNKVTFMMKISNNLKFITAKYIPTRIK